MSEPEAHNPHPAPPAGPAAPAASAHDPTRTVELVISNLLRLGVLTSLSVVALGLVLMFAHHPEYLSSREALRPLLTPGTLFPTTLHGVFAGLSRGEGRAVIALGLLLLIATPVLRVAVSIIAFLYERDRKFVAITAMVLTLLLLSFVLGRVEQEQPAGKGPPASAPASQDGSPQRSQRTQSGVDQHAA